MRRPPRPVKATANAMGCLGNTMVFLSKRVCASDHDGVSFMWYGSLRRKWQQGLKSNFYADLANRTRMQTAGHRKGKHASVSSPMRVAISFKTTAKRCLYLYTKHKTSSACAGGVVNVR